MTIEDIERDGYRLHHAATRKGYTRVAERGVPVPYSGRFGTGYIVPFGPVDKGGKESTQYESIGYYIKR